MTLGVFNVISLYKHRLCIMHTFVGAVAESTLCTVGSLFSSPLCVGSSLTPRGTIFSFWMVSSESFSFPGASCAGSQVGHQQKQWMGPA